MGRENVELFQESYRRDQLCRLIRTKKSWHEVKTHESNIGQQRKVEIERKRV